MTERPDGRRAVLLGSEGTPPLAFGIIGLQSVALVFFAIDCVSDFVELGRAPPTNELLVECLVTLALAAGIVLSVRYAGRILADARRREAALMVARGALADHISHKFAEWGLSAAEAEVGMLAIKGFQIADIARLRGAAPGTVRSQMSQLYAKAGVNSQAMFVACFLDDLLNLPAELASDPRAT